jgi:hypothetical protein
MICDLMSLETGLSSWNPTLYRKALQSPIEIRPDEFTLRDFLSSGEKRIFSYGWLLVMHGEG